MALDESGDEDLDSPDEMDSDDNVTREGRLKEDNFWSDEEEWNANKALNGRKAGIARKRSLQGGAATSSKPKKMRRFAKSKPFRRRRPLGKPANDPSEDVMVVSDVEDNPALF